MPVTKEDPLYTDPELAQFYDLENGWAADFDFCVGMAKDARSVLDLGCGTGELACALAAGRRVVGVDPAGAMLDIAKKRPGGELVEWVQADARGLELNQRFDLVVLTSHSFQVFLTDDDQSAVLNTVAHHLEKRGRFVFDTRNPRRKAWENWTLQQSHREITHPDLGEVEVQNEAELDPSTQIVRYRTHYKSIKSGQTFSAEAHIRFTPKPELAKRIATAGLQVDKWLGSWDGTAINDNAKEIIPVGCLSAEGLPPRGA